MMNKLFWVAAFLLICGSTYACKCKDPGTVKESFEKTSIIVSGKVVRYDLVSANETIRSSKAKTIKENMKGDSTALQLFEYRFIAQVEIEITEHFKGLLRKKTVIIYTSQSSASCGFSFEEGKEYVIYGSPNSASYAAFLPDAKRNKNIGKRNTYWTNLCTRTTSDVQNEVVELRGAVH
jgi:hypothetical protein